MMRTTLAAGVTALLGGVGAGFAWAHGNGFLVILAAVVTLAAALVAIWPVGTTDHTDAAPGHPRARTTARERQNARNAALPERSGARAERPAGA
ncbi:hypothetical protein [Paraoerskovia marina]|uniref:hypothetical protein n=1 Tax=Paraoerskovia marina TaxID=545619 RepID=UPI0004922868|nr:hypothetical protein [Paraoerskovia marina]